MGCEKNLSDNSDFDTETTAFLRLCSEHYDQLVDHLSYVRRRTSAEATASWLELIAGFAGMHHPGRFSDGSIDNVAIELGSELGPARSAIPGPLFCGNSERKNAKPRFRVVHVVTIALEISGYTKMLARWIRKDPDSRHSLILTRQGSTPIPAGLVAAIDASGGQIIAFSDESPILERAAWLRAVAAGLGDFAIMHLIPDDIIPAIAFSDQTNIPIAFVNLADQCFWLGSGVSDAIINLRDISFAANQELRFTRNNLSVLIPLDDVGDMSRANARKALGISDACTMLLTVGRAVKYSPSGRQNFFQTVDDILAANAQAELYIVGVGEDDHVGNINYRCRDRMHFVGPVADATLYQVAADIYLEGFPFGSQTALLEAVLPGRPCVRAVAPRSPLLAASDIALDGVAMVPCDEQAYIDQTSQFVTEEVTREEVGSELRKRVLLHHVEENWGAELYRTYDAISKIKHQPCSIPVTVGSARTVDLAISEYHKTRFRDPITESLMQTLIQRSILDAAFSLRQRNHYRDSLSFARLANAKTGWSAYSLAFVIKLLPHYIVNKISNR